MATTSGADKIQKIIGWQKGNRISENLRFVSLKFTNNPYNLCHMIYDTKHNFVGVYSSLSDENVMYISDIFGKDYMAEIKKARSGDNIKVIPHENLLLEMFRVAADAIDKSEPVTDEAEARRLRCKHFSAPVKNFLNVKCPDCKETVSPHLVFGNLTLLLGEMNENLWEESIKKTEKVTEKSAKVE